MEEKYFYLVATCNIKINGRSYTRGELVQTPKGRPMTFTDIHRANTRRMTIWGTSAGVTVTNDPDKYRTKITEEKP
jgi:hypothetical protein